ncbi:MAG: response regulator [Gammaproteobacteria bacterium]
MNEGRPVLLVDDDAKLGAMLAEYLAQFGFAVSARQSPSDGLRALEESDFAAAIFDVMLPEMDGLELCRRAHALRPNLPVMMLTARGDLADRVAGLETGADDYLAKPFAPRELSARLAALLRRAAPSAERGTLHFDGLSVNPETRRAWLTEDGEKREEATLTAAEFRVLAELVRRRPAVVERDYLTEKIRGFERDPSDRAIDIAVSRLRGKLRDSPSHPRFIQTSRGVGYAFIAAPKR